MKAIRFTNFSDEDFIGKWDKIEYPIKAGQTIMFEEFKANHFAQHLINRELTRQGIPTNRMLEREKMLKKCLGDILAEAESESELNSKMLNAEKPVVEDEEDISKYSIKALKDLAKSVGVENVDKFKGAKGKKELIKLIEEHQSQEKDEKEENVEDEEEDFEEK